MLIRRSNETLDVELALLQPRFFPFLDPHLNPCLLRDPDGLSGLSLDEIEADNRSDPATEDASQIF